MFKVRFVLLFAFLMCIVACAPTDPTADSVSVETVRPTATAVAPTPALSAINQLINDFTAAGATVVNNGRTEQGLFPGDNIGLWHVSINEVDVNVFEFSDTATRQATGENISPRGDTFTVTDGDTAVTTHWDWIELPYFWAVDNLIVNYWGEDTAVVTLITNVLGQPFADGSQPYRPEAGSGSIAGIGEYGVSFQYDPYLAAGIPAEMTMGQEPAGSDDFIYDLMPQHITFTFADSYAADWTLHHQSINIPSQPQILIFPLDAYASISPMAGEQIAALDSILRDRPDLPSSTLPHLPLSNGQQDLQAKMAYLPFQNGEGIRYLTQFNQEPRLINNQEIYYTFQGITADHAYYVVAFFPVQSDSLPAKDDIVDYEAFANNMPAYLAQTTADLNARADSFFTPDLSMLDFVMKSLLVEPNTELSPEVAQDIFCPQIPRPAILASIPGGFIISNPRTGENCPLVLPPNFGSISQVKDNYAYAYHFDESRNQLLVSQLAADGTVQEMAFMSPEDNLGFYSFVLSQDGRQLIWSTSSRVEEKLHSDLWIADLDGQNEVQLIADWQDNSRVIEPIRSDGETVYFHAQWEGIGGMWNSFHGRYDSLYTVKPGGEPQKLFACEDYGLMLCLGDISPDNSVLVYTDYRANNLHLIQADGTAIATIPLSGDYSGYPTFLANGDLVFYTAVLPENENGVAAQPGTLFYLAAPYTGPAREIISGPGIMFPITAYDAEHLIINYNDEQGQWGNALLNLTDSSVAPLQPWPGTYFVALVTAD